MINKKYLYYIYTLPLLLLDGEEAEKVVSTCINFGNSPAFLSIVPLPASVIPNTFLILLPKDCLLFGNSIDLGVVGVDDVDEGDILLDLDVLIGVIAVLLLGSGRWNCCCFTLEFEVEGDIKEGRYLLALLLFDDTVDDLLLLVLFLIIIIICCCWRYCSW